MHCTWGECTCQIPGPLSSSDLGRAQNTGPVESVPLWITWEPEQCRSGKCTQPRNHFTQVPSRATWSLSTVGQESTHAVSVGKPRERSPHTPVIFVCSVPPSLQHS
ncbi:unnamed protein product [Rangifer tarandus platyrhynchus]|uniref:Uncharacterized protein n=1 Tax=Rangifer tarandus platyrhynchus TaxID=3082113 RepID=A0ABN8YJM6_RANTA|nr:unnamed protein product [Rangifer tarandus platyrhynchus]